MLEGKRARLQALRQAAEHGHVRAGAVEEVARVFMEEFRTGLQESAAAGELVASFEVSLRLAKKRGLEGDAAVTGAVFAILEARGRQIERWLHDRATLVQTEAFRVEGAAGELQALLPELEALVHASRDVAIGEASGHSTGPRPIANGEGPRMANGAPGGD